MSSGLSLPFSSHSRPATPDVGTPSLVRTLPNCSFSTNSHLGYQNFIPQLSTFKPLVHRQMGGGGGVSCNVSKGVPTKILLQPPPPPPHSTSEPATVMVQWQTPYHLQVSSQIAQSVITASSLLFICCPSFNSGPSSKPSNSSFQ